MIERLLIAFALLIVGYAVYQLYVRAQLARPAQGDPLLAGVPNGVPIILYFTTPMCIPCRTVQLPALNRLQQEVPVSVVRVDATEQPEAADRWGVISAPTTFIIDSAGKTHAVNHGVADFEKLKRQLSSLRTTVR
ncbi:MAG: thioredoxin family protein [Anaerolineae bacterium]|nr:thioredoxin family protein [Anaerolineae bacterium]